MVTKRFSLRQRWKRLVGWGIAAFAVLFLLIQLIPYGRDHDNPPLADPIGWNSPRTEELARDACMDCHSNQTEWPWYSNIAPVSWLVQRDVDNGRDALNFSDPDDRDEGEDAAEAIRDGDMPPLRYILAHPEANLSEEETQQLIDGFLATFGDD